MAEPGDLEARMTALETQVADLTERVHRSTQDAAAARQDAAAARVLAGGADRDVTEIREEIRDFRRATTASFNAMREDMIDGFTAIRGRLDAAAAGQQQLVDLLNILITEQGEPTDQ